MHVIARTSIPQRIALITIVLAVGAILGGITGWLLGTVSTLQQERRFTKRQEELQGRIEGFSPSCDQLKTPGVVGPLNVGNDLLVIHVDETFFYVFGFNADPGLPPVTAWWGAGRVALMDQVCAPGAHS